MRQTLPNVRSNVTRVVHWDGHDFTVTIGLDPETWRPVEVFADAGKGGDMHVTIADACVWASLLLQFGAEPADLRKSLGEVPVLGAPKGTVGPASPLGAIADAILAEVR